MQCGRIPVPSRSSAFRAAIIIDAGQAFPRHMLSEARCWPLMAEDFAAAALTADEVVWLGGGFQKRRVVIVEKITKDRRPQDAFSEAEALGWRVRGCTVVPLTDGYSMLEDAALRLPETYDP